MFICLNLRKKQIAIILLALITLLVTMSTVLANTYIGSAKSDKFHYPSCRYVRQIYDENKITLVVEMKH